MECDLGRLTIATDAARDQYEQDWRERYKIAGWKVETPIPEPEDDEAFNDQLRQTLALFRKQLSS